MHSPPNPIETTMATAITLCEIFATRRAEDRSLARGKGGMGNGRKEEEKNDLGRPENV